MKIEHSKKELLKKAQNNNIANVEDSVLLSLFNILPFTAYLIYIFNSICFYFGYDNTFKSRAK